MPPYVTPLASAGGLSAPGYLTAIAQNRAVLLSWYPSEGSGLVSGYLIFRGEAPDQIPPAPINKGLVTENNYSDNDDASVEGPKNRRSYYYRVRAYNTEGRLSPYSDVAAAQPNGPLLPPAKLEVQEGDGKLRLRWSPPLSSGEHEFAGLQLYRSNVSGGGELLKELPMEANSYEDGPLENGKAYYYTLKSKDDQGKLSASSPELRAVPYKPLEAPKGLQTRGVGDEAISLKWSAPEAGHGGTFKVKGYNVYRSTQAGVDLSSAPLNRALIPAGRTKWEDGPDESAQPPKKGVDYHYVLVAVDEEGKPSPPSAESVTSTVESLSGFHTGEVEVAKDSTLKIEGRKTINASNTWIVQSAATNSPNSVGQVGGFQLDQQLQVRLTGKVGRKIKVDVDYDDKAVGSQQQKISVVYTGDQQEVFKEFAFGDIVMDLNSSRTEFAGYNKSLFGAKLKLESPDSRLRLTAIGAQTKGFTETKRFVGGYEQVKTGTTLGRDIPDSAFASRRYFYLTREKSVIEGADYIVPNSVQIWLDQPGNKDRAGAVAVDDAVLGSGKFYFMFQTPNLYTLDNASGLINFTGVIIGPRDNIAVAFKIHRANGTEDSVGYDSAGNINFSGGLDSNAASGKTDDAHHLIQYANRNPSQYDSHMSFQFYNLGNQNILNPQLDPDFKMVIYGTGQTPVFQLDSRSNFSDVVNFDPRTGSMVFRVPFPFVKQPGNVADLRMDSGFGRVEDLFDPNREDVYNQARTQPNFTIHVEYKYKLPSYSLRFGIIKGSEYITLDGRKLARDIDYYLDPDTGYLSFNNPDLVKDNSVVEATYEYLPFGGQFTSTIWGTRGEYDVNKNLSLGSTFIWNSSDATQEVPDVRSTPYSVQLLDGDVQAVFPQDALDSLAHLLPGLGGVPTPLKINARAEAAHSWYRPNTYSKNNESGVAMIDSFEAVDNLVSTSVDQNAWFPAASPVQSYGGPQLAYGARRFSKFVTELERAHDAAQRASNNENPNRSVIKWTYGAFDGPGAWDAFVYSFGKEAPREIANASYLEVWVKVEGGPVTLHFDVGEVNRDADGNGVLDTESNAGYLGTGQDVGFYNSTSVHSLYPLPSERPDLYVDDNYWGGGNNVIDTEDLDGTGSFGRDVFYQFSQTLNPVSDPSTLDYQLIQIPLTSAGVVAPAGSLSTVPGSANFFTNVKEVRMWIDGVPAGQSSGTLTIESVQFKGNKWQLRADPNVVSYGGVSPTVDTNKFQVNAINRLEAKTVAPGLAYSPNLNFFNKATSGSDDREQALQLEYALTRLDQNNGQPFYQARRALSSSLITDYDFANYQKLRVDVYKPLGTLPGERLLIRLVKDDLNYFEYQIFLDQMPTGAWQTVTLALDGSDGHRSLLGQPYLRNVRSVALAIHSPNDNPPPGGAKERIWLNNLRLTDAIVREGGAQRLGLTYDLMNGVVTVTEDLREVQSDFVKIDEQANPPQRRLQRHSVDARVNMVQGLPVTARVEDSWRFTEANHREDPLYSRNFVDPDESSRKSSLGVSLSRIPNLVVNANASTEHTRQTYLPTYTKALRLLPGVNDPQLLPDSSRDSLRLSNDNTYTVPKAIWGLNGDSLRFEYVYDQSSNTFDRETSNLQNISYRNTAQQTVTYRGRYSGQGYKWGPWATWVTVSPGFAFTEVQSKGNIPQPIVRAPYYSLGPDRKAEDYVLQSQSINPSLLLNFESLGVLKTPRINYNFTRSRDYVRNDLRSPGSLDLASSLDFNPVFASSAKLPNLDFTQSFAVDSTTNNEPRVRGVERSRSIRDWFKANPWFRERYPDPSNDTNLQNIPSVALLEQQSPLQSTWWVRLEDPFLGETVNDALNIENIAQNATKRSSSNLSTRFELPISKDWTGALSPRVNLSNERTMSAPEQVTRRNQLGYGSGLDFANPKVPFWQTLKPSNLSFTYDYTVIDQYVVGYVDEQRTSNRYNSNLTATLPTRPTERNAITFKVGWSGGVDTSFSNVGGHEQVLGRRNTSSLEPSVKWVYFLSVDRPWKLPDLWPFYGRELRIRQNFRVDNDLGAVYRRDSQDAISSALPSVATDLYSLRNQLGYNVLDNVTLNFILDQRLFQDHSTLAGGQALAESRDYYAIKFELGLEARF